MSTISILKVAVDDGESRLVGSAISCTSPLVSECGPWSLSSPSGGERARARARDRCPSSNVRLHRLDIRCVAWRRCLSPRHRRAWPGDPA